MGPAIALSSNYVRDLAFREVDGVEQVIWCKIWAESLLGTNVFLPSTEIREFYNTWESVLGQINDGRPNSLGNAFQVAGEASGRINKWVFMVLQETYVLMALGGVVAGLVLAFLVLLVATQNVIVSGL